MKRFFIASVILFIAACSTGHVWKSSPIKQIAKNSCFNTRIDPAYDRDMIVGFDLKVKNNCKEDVQIIWDKTVFMFNSKNHGTFLFNGENKKALGSRKPETIKGESVISRRIFPVEYVTSKGQYTPLKEGKNGVFVTVKKGLRGYHETLLLNISIQEK